MCLQEAGTNTGELGDPLQLTCSHAYHTVCITQWFRFSKTCPQCVVQNPQNQEVDDCMICLNPLYAASSGVGGEAQEIQTLVCDHKFHKACIEGWFQAR